MDKQRRNIKRSHCLLAVIFMMLLSLTTQAAIYEMDPNDQITLQAQQVVAVNDADHAALRAKIDDAAFLIAKKINTFLNRLFSTALNPHWKKCCKCRARRRAILAAQRNSLPKP